MSSLFTRRGSRFLYAKIKDVTGAWRAMSTGFTEGQEAQARAWVRDREREVAALVRQNNGAAVLTVADYATQWHEMRRKLGVASNHDYPRLRDHVLSTLGPEPIADIRPRHLVELFVRIRTTPLETTSKPPAPRTVHNIYSAVCALFRDAALAGHVEQSPCLLTEQHLGVKVDQDREWRASAVFSREEAQALISSPKIPWDRRVAYAIELLAGTRPGETAALRWRHYDPSPKPLGALTIAHSYDTKGAKTKGTKTDTVKVVPVHATLAAILAEWKLGGWAEMVGRAPGPDDLIVPLPPADASARTKRSEVEPFRTYYYAGRRWRDEDLPALGWRSRRHYDLRATFITLAVEDGADEETIEERVTHAKRKRSAFAGYVRSPKWAATCAEVSKLQLVRDLGAVLSQVAISAEDSTSSGLRRRVSNDHPDSNGDRPREPLRVVASVLESPDGTGSEGGETRLGAVATTCDLGLALLRLTPCP